MRVVAFLIAGVTGCSFDVDSAGTGFRCELTADCPSGLVCSAGTCRDAALPKEDAGTTGGADAASCPPEDACPEGYLMPDGPGSGGSCYRFNREPAPWEQAEAACEADCAHLVVIGEDQIDVDEHHVVHDLSVDVAQVWIGVTDRQEENRFRWVTGSLLDLAGNDCFWELGEPDDDGIQDCVLQRAVNVCRDWATVPCDEPLAYVCEYDRRAVEPGAF